MEIDWNELPGAVERLDAASGFIDDNWDDLRTVLEALQESQAAIRTTDELLHAIWNQIAGRDMPVLERAIIELRIGDAFQAALKTPNAGYGSIPDLTGDESTDEYLRRTRGVV